MENVGKILSSCILNFCVIFCFYSVLYFILNPDVDDVITVLRCQKAIEIHITERGTLEDILVDEKFRPLLMLWEGKGLSFSENVVHH